MKSQLAEEDRPPATLTLEEYSSSLWRPDCDFVDGRSEERNVGTFAHSSIVSALLWMLAERREPWSISALPSLRVRVSPTRVRVPDICVIARSSPREQVLTHPPLAIIEVLEEEDRFSITMEKLADFERFGIQFIWIIDPEPRIAYRYTSVGLEEMQSGELTVPGTPVRVVLSEMFAELDRA
jgi:Uma2 family endonuclease